MRSSRVSNPPTPTPKVGGYECFHNKIGSLSISRYFLQQAMTPNLTSRNAALHHPNRNTACTSDASNNLRSLPRSTGGTTLGGTRESRRRPRRRNRRTSGGEPSSGGSNSDRNLLSSENETPNEQMRNSYSAVRVHSEDFTPIIDQEGFSNTTIVD